MVDILARHSEEHKAAAGATVAVILGAIELGTCIADAEQLM